MFSPSGAARPRLISTILDHGISEFSFYSPSTSIPLYAPGMLKRRRENRLVNCLVCWICGGRMGPNHFTLKDGGASCGICGTKNPLGNPRRMSIQEVTQLSEIIVCFTQGGTCAHALHIDCKTVLGPWIRFESAETLERAMVYLGAAEEQIATHRSALRQTGQGSSHLRLLPNRKNLLKVDWEKL